MTAADRRAPRALLLTAGLGTRLQPLTYVRAKAAVPINGEALVRRVIRGLAIAGIRDLVLNLHHRPASIAALVGDGSDLGVRVRYSWEQPVLGSAGGPRHALPLVTDSDDDDFLIVNGDTLTDVDVWSLLARHRESGALVTMALDSRTRGRANMEESSSRPRAGSPGSRRSRPSSVSMPADAAGSACFHFIGVQVASARAFATLEDGVPAESVNALYPPSHRRASTERRRLRFGRVVPRYRHAPRLPRHVARARRDRRRAVHRGARDDRRFGGARAQSCCGMM